MGDSIQLFCKTPYMPLTFSLEHVLAWYRQRVIKEESKTQKSKSNPEAQALASKRT